MFIRVSRGSALPIVDRKHHKDRNQKNPGNRDLVRKRHASVTIRGEGKS
jgi:hypothetical protein